jgi:hypothetical protein
MLASASATFALIWSWSAVAQDHDDLPPGPYIDFCPSQEQAEAHLQQYGFDYKPTVACTSEGEAPVSDASGSADLEDQELSDEQRDANEKALLMSARRAPDSDGDPATMEATLPDGRQITIFISTDNPERYRGMTPAEFAEEVYR